MTRSYQENTTEAFVAARSLFGGRKAKIAGGVVAAALLANASMFIIHPSELGNIRRMGNVVYKQPLESGLHFKFPFIDKVDVVQVSLTTIHIPSFDVLTVDNQKVSLETNFNFTIPKDKVNHVLYEVGRSGQVDIDDQVIAVAKDRIARVFAVQNMVSVNANREDIQGKAEREVSMAVQQLFGIQPHSLQIPGIKPSDTFMTSIDNATKSKNAAIAAENDKRTKQFQADQVVITAKGAADAAIETARGLAESTRLQAEAEKTQAELQGKGEEARLTAELRPFGSVDNYTKYMQAKAQLNWKGYYPDIVAGQGAGTNFVLPLPAMAGRSAGAKAEALTPQ